MVIDMTDVQFWKHISAKWSQQVEGILPNREDISKIMCSDDLIEDMMSLSLED